MHFSLYMFEIPYIDRLSYDKYILIVYKNNLDHKDSNHFKHLTYNLITRLSKTTINAFANKIFFLLNAS